MSRPLIIEVTRGPQTESRHRVHVCVSDAQGRIKMSHGDEALSVLPRSAIKPIQALPLVESGAAKALGLTLFQLSLACASHNAEPLHAETVVAWLDQLGLREDQLVCAGHWSINQAALIAQATSQITPSQRHNNCSGKHCGLLSLAKHRGVPVDGYERAEHPVQQELLRTLEEMTASKLEMQDAGIDGCGIPTVPVPLKHLAQGFARWADPRNLPPSRQEAIQQISDAIWDHPLAMAGTGRYCSKINALKRSDGIDVLVKTGAEGVFCAALTKLGLGIALKVEDGATRASEVALTNVLDQLGLFKGCSAEIHRLVDQLKGPAVTNWAGDVVGAIGTRAV